MILEQYCMVLLIGQIEQVFNEETFNVDSDNRELAEQFADKFLELKREAVKQQFASAF